MKNLSLILNGILAIAVAILFYQVHSLKSSGIQETSEASDLSVKPIIASNTTLAEIRIALTNTMLT
jgi:hypothetical protein